MNAALPWRFSPRILLCLLSNQHSALVCRLLIGRRGGRCDGHAEQIPDFIFFTWPISLYAILTSANDVALNCRRFFSALLGRLVREVSVYRFGLFWQHVRSDVGPVEPLCRSSDSLVMKPGVAPLLQGK